MAARNPDRVSLARLAADIETARKLEAKIKALQEQHSPIIAKIKAMMGDATFGTIGRAVVVEWSTSTRDTIDTKALRTEQPDVARKYTRTTTVRTFRLKDPE